MTTLIIPTDARPIAGPKQGDWTYSDWETLPDDGNRYEVIRGVLYMTTAPSLFHQWIIFQLVKLVGIPVQERGLATPFFAPVGVIMPGCEPVQPDFVLVLTANKAILQDRRIRGVPNLIVEVVSPGSLAYDTRVKLQAYAAAGVPEYAVINPETRTLSVYVLDKPGSYRAPRELSGDAAAAFTCAPDITFKVSDLFAGAPDTTL